MRTLLSLLLLAITMIGCSGTATMPPPAVDSTVTQPTTGTVTILIEDGEQTIEQAIENVATGTTVEQVMKQLQNPKVKITGSGTTALVTAINERTNSGGEGWVYRVDGEWADRGIGAYELTPPTTISWKHGKLSEMME